MAGFLPRPKGSFLDESQRYQSNAIQARSTMRPDSKTTTEGAGATAGSILSGGMGGMMAGAGLGSMMAAEGAVGLAAVGGAPFLVGGAVAGMALSLF